MPITEQTGIEKKYINQLKIMSHLSVPTTVIPRFTVLFGGKRKCTVYRGHGKSGEVNTCSIVKHDIGVTQRGKLYRGTR